jgi:hypothetical protein
MVESMALPTPESPDRSPEAAGPPEPIAEDETLRRLMRDPVGASESCVFCREPIVQMPAGHYRTDTRDLSKDRVRCRKAPDGRHSLVLRMDRYITWANESGFHARLHQVLPQEALELGCLQEIHADNMDTFLDETGVNDLQVLAWQKGKLKPLHVESDPPEGDSFTTGDLP